MSAATRFAPAVAAAGMFVVMLILAAPRAAVGPQAGDSSELIKVALFGALAHPPGYPVWSAMHGAAVAAAPDNAFRTLALVSAIVQALAAAVLLLAAHRLARDLVVAVAVAAAWVLSPGVLLTATFAEVFALHHLFAAALVLGCVALLERARAPGPAMIAALGLACGLAGAHHPMIVLWAPLPALVLLRGVRGVGAKGAVVRVGLPLALGLVVGLLPYLTLPARFAAAPFLAFGHIESFSDVVRHALRMDYGTFSINKNADGGGPAIVAYSAALLAVAPLALAGGAASAWGALRAPRLVTVGVLAAVALHLALALALRSPDVVDFHAERFLPTVTLALLVGAAAAARPLIAQAARRGVWLVRGGAMALLLPSIVQAPDTLASADAAHDRILAVTIESLLSRAPQGAVLLDAADETSFGLELAQARGARPDLAHVITGRVDAWWSRARLRARHAFLRDLDLEAPSWLEPVVRAAFRDGRVVLATAGVPPVAGVVVVPFGPFVEWLPASAPIDAAEVARRAAAACAAIPDAAEQVDPRRRQSAQLRDAAWLAPLELGLAATHGAQPCARGGRR